MIQVIDQQKDITLPSIFFIALMILGNYMLLNLFLAILLKFISENSEHEKQHEEDGGECHGHGDDEDEPGKSGKKDADKKDPDEHKNMKSNADGQEFNGDDMNSSNSNIEEEFEQIKIQLQQLSNMNLNAA